MRKLSVVLLIATVVALILVRRGVPPSAEPKTVANPPATVERKKPDPSSQSIVFSSDGLAGRILHSAEGVAGVGNAKVAVLTEGNARRICILVAGMARNYSLDEGIQPEQLPFIAAQQFNVPDPHVLQTMSIFRSLAKTEMGFSAQQGDRIVVLMCPKEAWASLQLQWPEKVPNAR